MRVLFCGTSGGGDAFQLDRANASVLVEHDGVHVLLDCGAGSLRQIIAAGKQLTDIDAVAISHLHHDHVLGLAELFGRLVARNVGAAPTVYGPVGITDFVQRVVEMVRPLARYGPELFAAAPPVEVMPGEVIRVGDLSLDPFEVQHAADLQCFGWRVRAGDQTVIYSGDTAAIPAVMEPMAHHADLLIHDAKSSALVPYLRELRPRQLRERFTGIAAPSEIATRIERALRTIDGLPNIHGVARDVGRLAEHAHVRQLALTSIHPLDDLAVLEADIRSTYTGAVVVAYDGLSIDVATLT